MANTDYVPNTYFEVIFGAPGLGMSGHFTSVSGLSMEFEYETYSEGGSMFPRHFIKNIVPQTLVLEQGTVTTVDGFAAWMHSMNLGMRLPINGIISLKDHQGNTRRTWMISDALLSKYVGPTLNSTQPELAVSRIELQYNGCI